MSHVASFGFGRHMAIPLLIRLYILQAQDFERQKTYGRTGSGKGNK
jgi:hypothetical protein